MNTTPAISDADMHWAAGLFEGEGTITIAIRKSDETYRMIASVGNTDGQVVAFFQERWPSWVQPFYGERPGRQPGSNWTVAGPRCEAFVRAIRPFLRTDRVRAKADLALRFREVQVRRGHGRSEKSFQRELYLEMKALNRRGVALAVCEVAS